MVTRIGSCMDFWVVRDLLTVCRVASKLIKLRAGVAQW
jgi:hypothetical protein